MIKDRNVPLISVVVIAYRSAETIKETLDSIYNQTYPRLELVISDDKSTDDTIKVCEDWICGHKDRFEQTIIVVSPTNTGTAGNCNRGISAATGSWIKLVAGDDLIVNDGIEKLYDFSLNNPDADIVCGIGETFGIESNGYDHLVWQHNFKLYTILNTAEEQNWYLMRRNFISAGGVMMKKSLWESVGGYDEEIPLLEDWPMWIRITKAGHKIFFSHDVVSKYRLTDTSVRSSNCMFSYSVLLFYYKYLYEKKDTFLIIKKMKFLKKRSILSSIVYKYFNYFKPKEIYQW